MYKVFFNDKFVLLTDKSEFDILNKGVLFLRYEDFEELHYVIQLLERSSLLKAIVIHSVNIEELWADFRVHFTEIDAAGGIVSNKEEDVLIIRRHGKWDLPKGKLEQNERVEEAALREVKEECGIENLVLDKKIATSYHTYTINGKRFMKRTFWYAMKSDDTDFTPQLEEGIDMVMWEKVSKIQTPDFDTYASIKDVIDQYVSQDEGATDQS